MIFPFSDLKKSFNSSIPAENLKYYQDFLNEAPFAKDLKIGNSYNLVNRTYDGDISDYMLNSYSNNNLLFSENNKFIKIKRQSL